MAQLGRQAIVDAQITLAAKRDKRAPHAHIDALHAARAQPEAFGGGKTHRGNRRARERPDAEHGRQRRVVAVDGRVIEQGRIATGNGPQMIESELGRHDERASGKKA
jgi:hypothetical protein